MSIDSTRFAVSRSNGANVAKAVRAALEALGVGRVDVARELLSELLESGKSVCEADLVCADAEVRTVRSEPDMGGGVPCHVCSAGAP